MKEGRREKERDGRVGITEYLEISSPSLATMPNDAMQLALFVFSGLVPLLLFYVFSMCFSMFFDFLFIDLIFFVLKICIVLDL